MPLVGCSGCVCSRVLCGGHIPYILRVLCAWCTIILVNCSLVVHNTSVVAVYGAYMGIRRRGGVFSPMNGRWCIRSRIFFLIFFEFSLLLLYFCNVFWYKSLLTFIFCWYGVVVRLCHIFDLRLFSCDLRRFLSF